MPAVPRPDDTCPACGAQRVFHCDVGNMEGGKLIDGCAACLKVWERETRANPATEMCQNCAWHPGSPEDKNGELLGHYISTVLGDGIFYCHKRVPFVPGEGFEHQIAGHRCTNAPVCAGWIKAKLKEKAEEREAVNDEA